MRAALALLLVLLFTMFAAACGGANSEELQASRDREEEQHVGEEPADADQGESQPGDDETGEEDDGENIEAEVSDGDEDAGLEEQQDKGADEGTPTPAAEIDTDAARELFGGACAGCHTLSDANATGAVGPNLDETELDAEGINQQILNGGGGMPPQLLTGEDAELVAAYVAQSASQ